MAENHSEPSIFLIDTNIFLELLLERKRAQEVVQFLSLIEKGSYIGLYSIFTLHSLILVLLNFKKESQLLKFLGYVANHNSFQLVNTSLPDEKEIVKIMSVKQLDFDDATQYYFAKKTNSVLVSFDKHFDKTDLKRKEPRNILEIR